MFPMNRKPVPVVVTFLRQGSRVGKWFADAYVARRFYAVKMRAGLQPHVAAAGDDPMSDSTTPVEPTTVAPATKVPATKAKAKKSKAKGKKAPKAKPKKAAAKKTTPKTSSGVTPNMLKVLKSLKTGRDMTAAQLSKSTGIVKGKKLPKMVEAGLLKQMNPEEGTRGCRFQITAAGKKALETA